MGSNGHASIPPWRNPQYSTSTGPMNLNPTATSFVPSSIMPHQPTSQHYTPYQPLRVSNGAAERKVVEDAQKAKSKKSAKSTSHSKQKDDTPSVSNFASRYPVRTRRPTTEEVIPSIEVQEDVSSNQHHGQKLIRYIQTRHSTPRRTKSPPPPVCSFEYRRQAEKEPKRVNEPRKLLVVLDLNGTLLYRTKHKTGAKVHMRPSVTPFMDYLFENHAVMVYTSTMPATATGMVNQFLHPKYRNKLVALWARDKLDLDKTQYMSKVQVYKKLDKIWNDADIQQTAGEDGKWDQSNTILVDDSKLKALAQPHNLLQVPEYTSDADPAKCKKTEHKKIYKIQTDIVKQLQLKLEELKYQDDVSRLIRKWQAGETSVPKAPEQEVSVEETVDQKQKQKQEMEAKVHLPTPDSMRNEDEDENQEMPMETSDDEDDRGVPLRSERSVSSIDENVFRELLGSK